MSASTSTPWYSISHTSSNVQFAQNWFRTLRGPKWPLRVAAIEASGSSSSAPPVHGQNVDSTADSVVAQPKIAWKKERLFCLTHITSTPGFVLTCMDIHIIPLHKSFKTAQDKPQSFQRTQNRPKPVQDRFRMAPRRAEPGRSTTDLRWCFYECQIQWFVLHQAH